MVAEYRLDSWRPHVSGRCDWLGVVPSAAVRHDVIGLGRSPRIRFVLMDRRLVSEHRIDHAPRRFDRIFPDEECRVTTDGIAQQALVGQSFHRRPRAARATRRASPTIASPGSLTRAPNEIVTFGLRRKRM